MNLRVLPAPLYFCLHVLAFTLSLWVCLAVATADALRTLAANSGVAITDSGFKLIEIGALTRWVQTIGTREFYPYRLIALDD